MSCRCWVRTGSKGVSKHIANVHEAAVLHLDFNSLQQANVPDSRPYPALRRLVGKHAGDNLQRVPQRGRDISTDNTTLSTVETQTHTPYLVLSYLTHKHHCLHDRSGISTHTEVNAQRATTVLPHGASASQSPRPSFSPAGLCGMRDIPYIIDWPSRASARAHGYICRLAQHLF